MARSRLYLFCLALLAAAAGRHLAAADAPEPVVIEDFETGTSRWCAVQGEIPEGVKAFVTLTPAVEKNGARAPAGSASLPGPTPGGTCRWALFPPSGRPSAQIRVRLWVKAMAPARRST